MPRKRKRPDIYERQKQRRINNYYAAPLISEKYPNVQKIVIEMIFKDFDGFNDPAPRTMDFPSDARAYFHINCPYWECIDGGFDLNTAVATTIHKRQTNFSDALKCQGWQDRERIHRHHCFLELRFKISVLYKE